MSDNNYSFFDKDTPSDFEKSMSDLSLKAFHSFFNQIDNLDEPGTDDHELSPAGIWYYCSKFYENREDSLAKQMDYDLDAFGGELLMMKAPKSVMDKFRELRRELTDLRIKS